ncbi:MAG TPA: GLUG motif-containing protein [Steroidobacteraceae bacterium]|jgi:hypothetical protein
MSNAPVNLPSGNSYSTKQGSNGGTINYTVINSLGAQGSTTATDLQGMNGNKALNYALGSNIDASATSAWNAGAGFAPIGTNVAQFSGSFDGLGHTISGLTINLPGTDNIGMIGYTNSSARISNVGMVNVDITGRNVVGGLAGSNSGSISNSYTTGSVSGSTYVGGLAGSSNSGATINNSYATGTWMPPATVSAGWSGLITGPSVTATTPVM